jgi:spore germination cell wall hydrolase CwlJ-like protein
MEYMAAVIQNRVGTPGFASTVEGVITQKGQFQGFENYPNYSKAIIDRIEDMKGWATVKNRYQQEYKDIFAKAKSLAVDVTNKAVVDPYKGSGGLLYFRTAGSSAPYTGAKVLVTAGGQDFYGPRPK